MNREEFQAVLDSVQAKMGGEVIQEVHTPGFDANLPRWFLNFQGGLLMLDLADYDHMRLEVTLEPPHMLKILPKTFLSRLQGKSHRTGRDSIDRKYVVQHATPEEASVTLDKTTLDALESFHPFHLFEMNAREYKLHKGYLPDGAYDVDTALGEINLFTLLVNHIHKEIWGP